MTIGGGGGGDTGGDSGGDSGLRKSPHDTGLEDSVSVLVCTVTEQSLADMAVFPSTP